MQGDMKQKKIYRPIIYPFLHYLIYLCKVPRYYLLTVFRLNIHLLPVQTLYQQSAMVFLSKKTDT